MNHLDGLNWNWVSKWGYEGQARDRTIPGFIRADGHRDDEYERIPGLRLAPQYRGREYVGSIWVVENSTAAQMQTSKYKNDNGKIEDAIKDADAILSGDNECSKFFGKFGKYWRQALLALNNKLIKDVVENNNQNIGIRMEVKGANDFFRDSRIEGDKVIQEKAYRVPATATVNSNGPFFNFKSPARIGNYAPISRESRVLQILHELAHMIYKPDDNGGYEPLIPDDSGSGAKDRHIRNQHRNSFSCL